MVARLVIHLSVRPAMASRGDASRFPLDDLRHTNGIAAMCEDATARALSRQEASWQEGAWQEGA